PSPQGRLKPSRVTRAEELLAACVGLREGGGQSKVETYLRPSGSDGGWLPPSRMASRFLRMSHPKFDFSDLTPEERIQLAEDLWDSLPDVPELLPLTPAQAAEIDRRLAAYRADGDPGQPYGAVLDRLEGRLRERGG